MSASSTEKSILTPSAGMPFMVSSMWVVRPGVAACAGKAGRYQLVFYVAEYFAKRGVALPDPPFVDRAVIQFGITDAAAHYHVPLLASPWSYTTYRGS